MSDPVIVMDGLGNIWRRYNDVGYLRVTVEAQEAVPTLAVLAQRVGTITVLQEVNTLPLDIARAEARQYRESASHHRQIGEHYRDTLVVVRRLISPVGDSNCGTATEMITDALDNPPEWDGRLIA